MKCPQSEVHRCLLQVNKHNQRQLLCADTRVRLHVQWGEGCGGGGLAPITVNSQWDGTWPLWSCPMRSLRTACLKQLFLRPSAASRCTNPRAAYLALHHLLFDFNDCSPKSSPSTCHRSAGSAADDCTAPDLFLSSQLISNQRREGGGGERYQSDLTKLLHNQISITGPPEPCDLA